MLGATKALQSNDFFKRYTEQTRQVAGGAVDVVPLELIAETSWGRNDHALHRKPVDLRVPSTLTVQSHCSIDARNANLVQ